MAITRIDFVGRLVNALLEAGWDRKDDEVYEGHFNQQWHLAKWIVNEFGQNASQVVRMIVELRENKSG